MNHDPVFIFYAPPPPAHSSEIGHIKLTLFVRQSDICNPQLLNYTLDCHDTCLDCLWGCEILHYLLLIRGFFFLGGISPLNPF